MTIKELYKFFDNNSAGMSLVDPKRKISFFVQKMPSGKKLIPEADALKYMNGRMYHAAKDTLLIFPVNITLKKKGISIKRLDKKTAFGPKANGYVLTRKRFAKKLYKWLSEEFS